MTFWASSTSFAHMYDQACLPRGALGLVLGQSFTISHAPAVCGGHIISLFAPLHSSLVDKVGVSWWMAGQLMLPVQAAAGLSASSKSS